MIIISYIEFDPSGRIKGTPEEQKILAEKMGHEGGSFKNVPFNPEKKAVITNPTDDERESEKDAKTKNN